MHLYMQITLIKLNIIHQIGTRSHPADLLLCICHCIKKCTLMNGGCLLVV